MSIHLERPLITEIQVRMDCNGCVQKIRRALQTLQGIYDVYIDFPNQKVTVVGWVDPDQLMKAIKKAGKRATLCSHVRDEETARADPAAASSSDPATVTEETADANAQAVTEQTAGDQPPPPPEEQPAAEAPAAPAEAPPPENADQPAPADPAPENPTPDPVVIPHDHPIHGFLIRNGLDGYQVAQEHMMRDADYRYANEYYARSYNAPEYNDPQRRYNRRYMGGTGEQYYYNNGVPRQNAADGNRFTSIFSDENPNACSIS